MSEFNQSNQDTSFDINKLLNMLPKESPTPSPPKYLAQASALDQVTNNEHMQIIKAAIPFLEHNMQKQLAIMVKFLELKNTFNLYNNDNYKQVEQLNLGSNNREAMLSNIRSVCSDCNKNLVDIVLNMLNINKLMQNYQRLQQETLKKEEPKTNVKDESTETTTSNTPFNFNTPQQQTPPPPSENKPSMDNTMIEGLKSMLSPEQRNMVDMFSTMMKMNSINNNQKENDKNE
ncbi:hypothetical protein EDC18_10345 [Natranaerovirga pectinivora]|uniref:Uncharacterized protein n=1 Tax=Natranaerovirga pectinivora TaxID=682400 RepID=A0A4R3MQ96_9FIRM|nr:hypothetical protein [Natranaerovirga pectinivora]TCT15341.1 hypothetical protein EDC18_10345 [Natranaerovirga pectinivora]